jgi:hypothetical protein
VSAFIENGVSDAEVLDTSDGVGPLPLNFREFIEQRLGVDRERADALLGCYARAAWDLGRARAELLSADSMTQKSSSVP